ncbi:DNA/RNA non-specific endonuclease [Agarivorans albus]|nr:DNA/RNA non-specific endonuclease [Agarivorans albus]
MIEQFYLQRFIRVLIKPSTKANVSKQTNDISASLLRKNKIFNHLVLIFQIAEIGDYTQRYINKEVIMKIRMLTLAIAVLTSHLTHSDTQDPYSHDKWVTQPQDTIKEFIAFTASMDSKDDNNDLPGDDVTGTPEWVAYEIREYLGECIPTKGGHSWKAEKKFEDNGIAPKDNSYAYSNKFRSANPDWYVRGHLQMKLIAERISNEAAAQTFTFLNAVPQRKKFNSGIWLDLEYITSAWAQEYGKLWVITGPIYIDGMPSGYIGEGEEFKVAIPDALFKIVVRESNLENPDVLAFIYPQLGAGYYSKNYDHSRYLTSIAEIEEITGLSFLNSISEIKRKKLKAQTASDIWPYKKEMITRACRG